jgi:hypothetical protein
MRIVVMGFMGSCPISGVVWQHIHYIVGLMDLGHDVFYIEDSARLPYNPETFETSEDYRHAVAVLERLSQQHGFAGRWGYCPRYLANCENSAGLSLARIRQLYREADLILNVCGSQELNADLVASNNIVYVESDPGVEQIKVDLGVTDTMTYLARHRSLFTFGENVGADDFPVPTHGLNWMPTRQPVVTRYWTNNAAPPPAGAVFTTIANWSTSGRKDIAWRGDTYLWSKSLEFLKFVEAPRLAGEPFEMATDIQDTATQQRFLENEWRLVLPHEISANFEDYRSYIKNSKGEFTAAKDQYVRLRTGWFSDRSACYLAAGRPVITQETGFSKYYGGDKGLLAFRTVEEIPELIRQILSLIHI